MAPVLTTKLLRPPDSFLLLSSVLPSSVWRYPIPRPTRKRRHRHPRRHRPSPDLHRLPAHSRRAISLVPLSSHHQTQAKEHLGQTWPLLKVVQYFNDVGLLTISRVCNRRDP